MIELSNLPEVWQSLALAAPCVAAVKLILDKNIKILSAEIIGRQAAGLPIDTTDEGVNLIIAPDDSKIEVILKREGDRSP